MTKKPVTKTKPFLHMLLRLREKHVTLRRTCNAIGISDSSYYKLVNDGVLTSGVARKILEAFSK